MLSNWQQYLAGFSKFNNRNTAGNGLVVIPANAKLSYMSMVGYLIYARAALTEVPQRISQVYCPIPGSIPQDSNISDHI